MFKLIFNFIIFFLCLTFSVYSKNYEKIIINGNERISNETIIVFSEISNGKSLDENSINKILRRLYNTGFFKDVSIKIEDNQLIINVDENPIIQTVFIEGVKTKKIKNAITDILSLKDRSSYNITLLKQDENAIINLLKERGYYFSNITTSIVNLDDKKINLIYNIDIGNKSKISKISFIGNTNIKDKTLRNIIVSEEYKFWKLISGKKFLNEKLLNFDTQLLKNFYKNRGFFDVKIESSYAKYLGNDEFEIIYNISPGIKYYFNEISLNLPTDYNTDDFAKLNNIFEKLKGKNYSLTAIDKILNEIDKIVLNEQYEFLDSTVNEEFTDNLISLEFNVDEKSEKFYVEKINIFGNNITREDVIRNSLYVDEGDPFNDLLHTKSINRIKSLNFFKDVKSEIISGTNDNQKIINISVNEKPTGEITAGAGVGSSGGSISVSAAENNFLGRGIKFDTSLTLSANTVRGLFSLNNPNYKGSNRSLNFSVQSLVTDQLKDFGYKSNKSGFSIGSGYELYDDFYFTTGLSTYVETLKTDATASDSMSKQKGSYFDTFFNYTLDYDKRNQRFKTTDGFRSKYTQNLPIISENYSLKNTYDFKIYDSWLKDNIATFSFYASSSNSLTNKDIKLSERLYLPSSKLRGFEPGKIGPKDGEDFIGGNYATALTLSTTMPQVLPGLQSTDFLLFLDVANVWGVDYDASVLDDNKIKSSIGLGIDWFTVIGPLNFSLTEVISKSDSDITESFRFNIGTTF
jgi:outer membrane protein insertion porin family